MLPIKPASGGQKEPMAVEEAPGEQTATEGKVWIGLVSRLTSIANDHVQQTSILLVG